MSDLCRVSVTRKTSPSADAVEIIPKRYTSAAECQFELLKAMMQCIVVGCCEFI